MLSGCYITSPGPELLQNVWDHVWRPEETWWETASLSELMGFNHPHHWSSDHGARRQHGPGAATQSGLSAGKNYWLLSQHLWTSLGTSELQFLTCSLVVFVRWSSFLVVSQPLCPRLRRSSWCLSAPSISPGYKRQKSGWSLTFVTTTHQAGSLIIGSWR